MHYRRKIAGSVVHKHTSHAWGRMGSSKILVLPPQLCHHNAWSDLQVSERKIVDTLYKKWMNN